MKIILLSNWAKLYYREANRNHPARRGWLACLKSEANNAAGIAAPGQGGWHSNRESALTEVCEKLAWVTVAATEDSGGVVHGFADDLEPTEEYDYPPGETLSSRFGACSDRGRRIVRKPETMGG